MRGLLLAITALVALGQSEDKPKGDDNLMRVPRWLPLIEPEHQKIEKQTSETVVISYDSDAGFASLVGHLESIFRGEVGNDFNESGDAKGTLFLVNGAGAFCAVRVSNQGAPHVRMECIPPKPKDVPKIEALPVGVHQVEYVVDGDCKAAALTYSNAGGGTEQREFDLPAALSFRATQGAFLYLSAQKKGTDGSVRVRIKVDGTIVRQSVSTSPYGIATANARL